MDEGMRGVFEVCSPGMPGEQTPSKDLFRGPMALETGRKGLVSVNKGSILKNYPKSAYGFLGGDKSP